MRIEVMVEESARVEGVAEGEEQARQEGVMGRDKVVGEGRVRRGRGAG